jgi:hypothetical protein
MKKSRGKTHLRAFKWLGIPNNVREWMKNGSSCRTRINFSFLHVLVYILEYMYDDNENPTFSGLM